MTKKANTRKKVVTIISLFLVSLFIIGIISAADVGYILKYESKAKKEVLNAFKEMGLTYDLIQDSELSKYNLASYKLLFVDDVRLTNTKNVPIYNYPSVIMNSYYGPEWGLTSSDGISQLSANQPLSVRLISDGIKQVYTRAEENGMFLYYYYLDDKNCRTNNFQKVARTWAGLGNQFSNIGDVIAVAPKGTVLMNGKTSKGNMCFYGIANTEFWTEDAKQLFKQCVGYVGVKCSSDSDCPSQNIGNKYCKDGDVYQDIEEYSCIKPGTVQSQCVDDVISKLVEDCEYGCANGQCLPECTKNEDCDEGEICVNNHCVKVNCKNDSECGVNGYLNQLFCKNGNVFDKYVTFKCNNPGTASSYCSNSSEDKQKQTCTFGCDNGQCLPQCTKNSDCGTESYSNNYCKNNNVVKDHLTPTCTNNNCIVNNQTLTVETCPDGCINGACIVKCSKNSDCGTDGFVDGLFCKNGGVYQNFMNYVCNNPGMSNSYCSNSTILKLKQDCADDQICVDGMCVDINCNTDADCDDQNNKTEDKCINPGTSQSYCQHTNIICSINNDCGTDGFTGNKYCLDKDVYEDFITYTCKNPGKSNSYCISANKPILKDSCTAECINGACIGCFSNLDCGTNGYVGNKYCKGKDVYQDYKEYSCSNPGKPDSICSNTVSQKLIESCKDVCFNGACKNVGCSKNEDCDDSSLYTLDECNNPGTTSSYCSHTIMNCVTDADCGINGFFGEEFCFANDIYKGKQQSKCMNPKTTSSYCNIMVSQDLVNDCGNSYCEAYGENYCKGDSVYKKRTCYDKGCRNNGCYSEVRVEEKLVEDCPGVCSNGQCINILCSKNLDCGTDGYTGSKFCKSDDVYQSFISYVCNNPGTGSSSCSSSSADKLISDCGNDYCEAYGNNYCKDGNVYKKRACHDKGCSGGACFDNVNYEEVIVQDCVDGCSNGQCTQIMCSKNLDCGTDGYTGSKFCKSDDVYQSFISYVCNNPGTGSSSCSSSVIDKLISDCGDDYCTGYGSNYCKGSDVYKKRTCYDKGCSDGSCFSNSNIDEQFVEHCHHLCSDGKCINMCIDSDHDGYNKTDPMCPGSNDCNDNNANVHPGATELCNGIDDDCDGQIDEGCNCCKNLDCGTDGYTGSKFCKSDDVYQKFKIFLCNNPQTTSSYCSNSEIDKLIQDCGNDYCEAYGNNYCKDGNVYKKRACHDKGCSGGACFDNTNYEETLVQDCVDGCSNGQCTQIMCSKNLDCGTDGYTGSKFCKSDDVYQSFISYVCNSPGTGSSSCSSSVIDKLISDCGDDYCTGYGSNYCKGSDVYKKRTCYDKGCSDGSCFSNSNIDEQFVKHCEQGCEYGDCKNITIICYKNSDCDDNDLYTIDECNNPGTPSSYCSHTPINCINDNDCGITGFSGEEYCSQDDLFKNFQISKCTNPGTKLSYCDSSVTQKLISDCGNDYCEAYGDYYCKNGDVYKKRTCHDKGCSDKTCFDHIYYEETIVQDCLNGCSNGQCIPCNTACQMDSDCGTDGFIGNGFCSGDDVFKNFKIYKCVNAGTCSSYCANSSMPKFFTDCGDDYCTSYGSNYCKGSDVYKKRTCYDKGCSDGSCFSNSNDEEQFVEHCASGCENGECKEECAIEKRSLDPITKNYIKFSTKSIEFNSNNSEMISTVEIQNLRTPCLLSCLCPSTTIEYELYKCRCDEKEGDPSPFCIEYWPSTENNGGYSLSGNCVSLGKNTISLKPGEKKTVKISVSQYNGKLCGSMQVDFFLNKIGYTYYNQVVAGSLVEICADC